MSYHYERGGGGGYNNYNNRGGGGGGYRQNQPRINENEVPQSKHTIFVRGLPGDVTTEEIKEYIGQRFGTITFDFVKHSQDRSKLFVAVRFEKRDEAKEFMDSYSSHDFMGSRCDLSWFRDIRRYCAYKRSKQVRSNSQRRRRRSDSEDSRRSVSPVRRSRSGTQSRSVSRSQSRSRSRSQSDRSRSRSSTRRSRSVSRSSRRSNGFVDEEEETKVRERQARNKRRRELSVSEDDESADEKPKRKPKEEQLPQIPLPPRKKEASPAVAQPAPKPAKPPVFIPPPTVDMEVESPKPSPPAPQNPYQRTFERKESSPATVHSTSYSVPMEEEAAPKVIVREAQTPVPVPSYPIPTHTAAVNPVPVVTTAPPSAQRSFVPRQVAKFEFVMPTKLPVPSPTVSPVATPSAQNGTHKEDARLSTSNKLFGDLKDFQTALISTVKFEQPIKEEEEEGSLFLSSQLEDSEMRKCLEREEKLNKLNADQNVQFLIKKNQFVKSFRGDCETYAAVTRGLLSKNESLAIPIKIALFENMDDMYKKFLKRVDDLLDTMI